MQPVPPELARIVDHLLQLGRVDPARPAAHGLEHHPCGLAFAQRRRHPDVVVDALHVKVTVLAEGGVPVPGRVECQVHPPRGENEPVRGDLQRVRSSAVVEPRLDVHHESHRAAYHLELPDQAVPVRRLPAGDRHEVGDLADPVLRHEAGDQHGGVGEVELTADVIGRVGRDPEVAALVRVEQRGEHARGVEPRAAEPVHGPVGRYQGRRLQVSDQAVVADVRVPVHVHPLRSLLCPDPTIAGGRP